VRTPRRQEDQKVFKHKTDIDRLVERSKRFRNAHEGVAKEMGEGHLLCANCKIEVKLDVSQVENYLREGWPKCCVGTLTGGTMRFFRRPA
jgi:hypothetical protein